MKKSTHGGPRPNSGRPRRKTPKLQPISIGQILTPAERGRILRLIPAEERGEILNAEAQRREETK